MLNYGGNDLSVVFGDSFTVNAIRGRGVASKSISNLDKLGDGAFFQFSKVPMRIIQIDFTLKGTSNNDLRTKLDQLNEILYSESEQSVVFSDELDMTYFGIASTASEKLEVANIHQGTLTISCSDPFKYGIEQEVTFSDTSTITYSASVPTYPTVDLTFTASASEYKIVNQDGEYVRVIRDFIAGDNLVIDFARKKVVLNDVTIMPSLDLGSEFFAIKKGDNTLTVTPSTESQTLTFAEKWL